MILKGLNSTLTNQTNKFIIVLKMMRDHEKDNMKCGNSGSRYRVFDLWGAKAEEKECRDKCTKTENCVAMSGVWGQWCIGCSVALNTAYKPAKAFKKGHTQTVKKGNDSDILIIEILI